ncbi:hypothetical protein [Streptomyces sp. NPDC004134]|uniref:hypothetical protein n=1 Tax=Streptomyces sp. NPDC004134 TaxID=3364691 RepID=UPI0036CB8905
MSQDSELFVVMVTLDREASAMILTRSDGKEARQPMPKSTFAETSVLSRLHYSPQRGGLLAVTCAGDELIFEMPTRDAVAPLADRPVVYLDQNMWRPVSESLQGKVAGSDRRDAERLAKWVQERRIILPASAGHYYETTKWSLVQKRYRLGLTILQLSRGWQMRDPLQVRRDEIRGMFLRRLDVTEDASPSPVFTLAPNVIHSSERASASPVDTSGFAPEMAFRLQAFTSASALIDTMLDTEQVEPGPDAGWAANNQRFSDWLDEQPLDSQQKRKSIDALLASDLQREIAEEAHGAGFPLSEFEQWLKKRPMNDIGSLPAVGLYREMLHHRHLNKGTNWDPNDRTDMIYLSCAAGYADFVVCEKHMREPLERGVKQLGRPTKVFRRLGEAVAAIAEVVE